MAVFKKRYEHRHEYAKEWKNKTGGKAGCLLSYYIPMPNTNSSSGRFAAPVVAGSPRMSARGVCSG
jgi:hypothetical protein